MKSHIQKFGHRMKPEIVANSQLTGTYGGDNAFGIMYYAVRCKVCGAIESRKEYL